MNKYNLIDILSREIEIESREKIVRYSFNGIEVPMIQRDYAQGRKEETEVRNRFLKAIFDDLEYNKKLELDFVYGSIKKLDSADLFVPLDGQQRLTTLFLLHWYIGNRELSEIELKELRDVLKGFTYSTRTTSRKFCEILSQINISFLQIPSKEIMESSWFFDSYKKDPTVKAMLVMLDAIHHEYGNTLKSIYPNLSKLSFYILPLDGFDLSDELYIKMNARGKQLTNFENFKADLINWLKDDKNPFKEEFRENVEFKGRATPYYLAFGAKIDNDWTNLFWSFTRLGLEPKEKLVDPYFLEFWNRYLLNEFIIQSSLSQDAIENSALFQRLYGKEGNNDPIGYQNFDLYKSIFVNDGLLKRAELVLDQLTHNIKLIEEIIKPSWDKKTTFSLFSKEINQRNRVLFYAVTVYLELNNFEEVKFKNWIRVVWNIIIDPNIRSIPAMLTAMRLIQELSKGSANIYEYLKYSTDSILMDKNPQIEAEKIKAFHICSDIKWEPSIIEAESHPMFKGNIRFLFPELDKTDYLTFTEFKSAAFKLFKKEDGTPGTPENQFWLRATLSKTINVPLPINLADGRFENWNFLINNQLLTGITEVLKNIITSNDEILEILKSIIRNYHFVDNKLWLYYLVNWEDNKGKCLLEYSETKLVKEYQGYNEIIKEVYLFNQTIWTEGNILISNYRNEIISKLLNYSSKIKYSWEWGNIENAFFRGWDIKLERQIEDLNFTYDFDREHVKVGIKLTPELDEQFKDLIFDEGQKDIGWICRIKYDFKKEKQLGINSIITTIESEVFDKLNPNSLINIILNQYDLGILRK